MTAIISTKDLSFIKKVKAVLFDLDGTLIDTLNNHIAAFKAILKELDVEVSEKDLNPLMGRKPEDVIKHFCPDLDEETVIRFAIKKEEYMHEKIDSITVLPGVVPFLESLGSFQVIRIVISSTHKSLLNRLLALAELTGYFEDSVSGDEVKRGKPAPDPFLLGLAKSRQEKVFTVGIGDSIHDVIACNAAGITSIGVATGKTSVESLKKAGATLVIENFEDLIVE